MTNTMNVFFSNKPKSDTIYNPVTNKMVKRKGKIGKTLTSQYQYIFSGGSVVPFIENDIYWKTTPNGDPVYKCDKNCFPYDIRSPVPCLPRCLYTDMKGYDPYTQFDTFFQYSSHEQKTIF